MYVYLKGKWKRVYAYIHICTHMHKHTYTQTFTYMVGNFKVTESFDNKVCPRKMQLKQSFIYE